VTLHSSPTVIGNHVSPFVRKVLAVCRLKGITPTIDPIVPFFGNDTFSDLSPLRRIPLLVDGTLTLPDSTVICEYLEDIRPQPTMLPGTPAERARSRWLDEFADTRIAQVFLWGVFAKAVVLPGVFKTERDLAAIARHMAEEVPGVMDQLERQAPADGFIASHIGLGDLSVASHFANLRWSRQLIDAERWPRTCAWVARVEASDALAPLTALGDLLVRCPPGHYRTALAGAGVAVAAETLATTQPRRSAESQL
jgi:glutathione S-transferase